MTEMRWLRNGSLGFFVWLCCHAAIADTLPRQLHAVSSPLAPVVAGLDDATATARLDFAQLLVEALVEAYESELDPAIFQRRRNAAAQRKLARWHQSVVPLLHELQVTQAALYVASTVSVHMDRHEQIVPSGPCGKFGTRSLRQKHRRCVGQV
jgi:hypothetical protein